MNTTEMMDAISKYVDNKNTAVQTTAEIKKTKMIEDCNRVVAQLDKLRDIRPVVRMLFEKGLVKGHGTFALSMDSGSLEKRISSISLSLVRQVAAHVGILFS